jgi:hypothetical protein
MLRSSTTMALLASLASVTQANGGCAESSTPSVVVAPTVPAGSVTVADASVADADAQDAAPQAGDAAPAQFRACTTDADCIAVPRVGCCHNGWNEAVAASQKDAYATSFTCPDPHPMCIMMIVHDTRVPRCGADHLCTLVAQ